MGTFFLLFQWAKGRQVSSFHPSIFKNILLPRYSFGDFIHSTYFLIFNSVHLKKKKKKRGGYNSKVLTVKQNPPQLCSWACSKSNCLSSWTIIPTSCHLTSFLYCLCRSLLHTFIFILPVSCCTHLMRQFKK